MSLVIGIDLGTTNSLCAVFEDGKPRLIPNAHGDFLTPSVVGVLEDDQVIVGSAAKDYRVTHPERCASAFKRYMGTSKAIELGGREFSAPELSSLVLRSLKDDAEAHLKQTITDAVITVPAYFNDMQRKATQRAGSLAGLTVRRIINEPTAAALTYGFNDPEAEKKLMVIDLGGGTFDVTLMEIFEGTLEIISTAGESFLGGEDFTDRLTATVLKQMGMQLEAAELKQPLLVARLRQECEVAKRQLLSQTESSVRVPEENGEISEKPKKLRVTQEAFTKAVQPLLDRLKGPIGKSLRDGKSSPEELDSVILVGGATRMQPLRDFVAEFLKCTPLCEINPDEVVALGAAIQAALIEDNAAVEDIVMTDVCPFTLGVETVKKFGNRMSDGYYSPIIHRNTTIPVSREEQFQTVDANQTEVMLKIYQGESRRVKDNLKLGELRVTGIPPGPAGQNFYVRFTYDLNGILEVEAFVEGSGEKFTTVLTNNAQDMTEAEVKAAVKKMQGVKFYPRDDIENQKLVRFVERIVGELPPHFREEVEMALDRFEHAMASGSSEDYEATKSGLLMILSQLGIEYDTEQSSDDNAF